MSFMHPSVDIIRHKRRSERKMNMDKYSKEQKEAIDDFINSTPIVGWSNLPEMAMPLVICHLNDIYRKAHNAGMHDGLEIAKQYGVGK